MPGPEIKGKDIWYRIRDPAAFREGTFRSKTITPTIRFIVAKPKGSSKEEVQAIRFRTSDWTIEEARKWVESHREKLEFRSIAFKMTGSYFEPRWALDVVLFILESEGYIIPEKSYPHQAFP